MYTDSKMNSDNNSSPCEQRLSRSLSVIHPDSLGSNNFPTPPGIVKISSDSSINNMPYDEECCVDDDLLEASIRERELEDAYDAAYTKNMIEKFPNLVNTQILPPSIPTICIDNSLEYSGNTPTILREKKINLGDGKFEYVKDKHDRLMLSNAWQAITQTENWEFVAQSIDSFMWSRDSRIDIISNKMSQLGYDGHSGCSFGITMRNMQFLAKNGEEEFKKMFDKTDDSEENDSEENDSDRDTEIDPYSDEDAMEYEQRLKYVIKRRKEKKDNELKMKFEYGGHIP